MKASEIKVGDVLEYRQAKTAAYRTIDASKVEVIELGVPMRVGYGSRKVKGTRVRWSGGSERVVSNAFLRGPWSEAEDAMKDQRAHRERLKEIRKNTEAVAERLNARLRDLGLEGTADVESRRSSRVALNADHMEALLDLLDG